MSGPIIQNITAVVETDDQIYSVADASVLNGEELDTGVFDTSSYASITVRIFGFTNANQRITSSTDLAQTTGVVQSDTAIPLALQFFTIPCRNRYFRIQAQNNTGGTLTNTYLYVTGNKSGPPPPSTFPLNVAPTDFSPATLTQAVLRGYDTNGNYQRVGVNQFGALQISDFLIDVSQGFFEGIYYDTKHGRNSDIDTGAPEDIWHGGGKYTGHDATANENAECFSASPNDAGTLVSSGTLTAVSDLVLTDSTATFITDGVAVGDLFIDDTQGIHGGIASVDSETQITLYRFDTGSASVSDSYRIATTASTGAAVVKWTKILNSDYETQTDKYAILNGTSAVSITGDFFRCSRGKVVLCGSNDYNVGNLTLRQATTTANVFCVMPLGSSRTAIACDTVPAGKKRIILNLFSSMVRASGAGGSANTRFQKRIIGGCWETLRNCEIANGQPYDPEGFKGIVLQEKTDHKWRCASVSDNNTIVTGEFKYIDIDIV